jgi:hypothetical protein
MKFCYATTVSFLLVACTAPVGSFAFTPGSSQAPKAQSTNERVAAGQKQKQQQQWWAPMAAAAVGWTLAGPMAMATPNRLIVSPTVAQWATQPQVLVVSSMSASSSSSSSLYTADSMTLDFTLPSYNPNSKSSGFGELEAILNDRNDSEKRLEKEALDKAEAARLVRLEAKKADRKALEEEDKRRAFLKKQENAARLKNIWGD